MNWIEKENKLQLDLIFSDFGTAWAFMNEVAIVADKLNHHPTWSNEYNKVSISLTTQDAGNVVTDKDLQLADEISKILLFRNS
jgi:4a-hydroxytetrahydrobiopterin dehydratase